MKKKEVLTIMKYHRNGCQKFVKCPKNCIVLSRGNDKIHELGKCLKALDIYFDDKHDFICEAVSNSDGHRADIVDITDGAEVEIDFKHGNLEELNKRGVKIFKVK